QTGDPALHPLEDLLEPDLRRAGARARMRLSPSPAEFTAARTQIALPAGAHRGPCGVELPTHRQGRLQPAVRLVGVPRLAELPAHAAQHVSHPAVDAVDVSGRLLGTQGRNDDEVDGQTDRDAEGEFADALAEQGLLAVEAAAQDEDRGRGDGHALIP